jgi:hypothetical protein
VVAHIPHPRWKAFFFLLPIPFTFAVLALGQPINTTHVAGLGVLLGYTFMVKLFHQKLRVPIICAIVISALGYCFISSILATVLPKTDKAFLAVAVTICSLAAWVHYFLKHPVEPSQRSSLPVWKKFIVVIFVIMFLVLIKSVMQGFMTVFPMVGVIIVYEARLSLYTICRHIPITMLTLTPMMTTCYILQEATGIIPALIVGWVIFLIIMPLFILPMWRKYDLVAQGREVDE